MPAGSRGLSKGVRQHLGMVRNESLDELEREDVGHGRNQVSQFKTDFLNDWLLTAE